MNNGEIVVYKPLSWRGNLKDLLSKEGFCSFFHNRTKFQFHNRANYQFHNRANYQIHNRAKIVVHRKSIFTQGLSFHRNSLWKCLQRDHKEATFQDVAYHGGSSHHAVSRDAWDDFLSEPFNGLWEVQVCSAGYLQCTQTVYDSAISISFCSIHPEGLDPVVNKNLQGSNYLVAINPHTKEHLQYEFCGFKSSRLAWILT